MSFKRFIDDYLIVPKALYFFMNLAFYSCYTFRPKYLLQVQGIETKDYALVAAVLSLVSFFAAYFWSYLSDRLGKPKQILLATTVLSAIIFQFLAIKFPNDLRMVLATLISGVYIFLVSGFIPLLDALVMNMLTVMPNASRELYGRQRMWGTIAYAVISSAVGTFKELYPAVNIFVAVLSAVFVVFIFICLRDPSLYIIPKKKPDVESKVKSADSKTPAPADVQVKQKSGMISLLTNSNFLFLLLVVFMNGLARATMTHFVEPIQRNVFKTPPAITGASSATGVSLEIVVFFFGRSLLRIFGVRRMLLIAQTAMVARISCYAFLPQDFAGAQYAPLYYELFKGLSFGFMQTASVTWVTEIASQELKATAQALYSGVFSGLAAFVAGLIGYAFQNMGATKFDTDKEKKDDEIKRSIFMLQVTAYVSMAALVMFFVKYIVIEEWLTSKKKKQQKQQTTKA